MTNYSSSQSKRVARSRPGSLHNSSRPDYSRLRSGSCSNAESGHLRPDCLPVTSSSHRRSSFRMPARQTSIRESRRVMAGPSMSVDIPSLPPPSPRSRCAVVHRIPIHLQQQQPAAEDSKSKSMYCRSASLTSEPISRGWRSSIAKMIRAKSTSGNSVRSNHGERTDCSSSPSKNRRNNRNPSNLTGGGDVGQCGAMVDCDGESGGSSSQQHRHEGHIDICVIQATPAASPCTSIRSTFSGDSLDSAAIKNIPPYANFNPSPAMSVRDRRKCFARMKGQTIDHDNEAATNTNTTMTIDTSFLAPPMIEYSGSLGLSPSSLLAYPMADLRSRRSASPAARHSATTWLQVFNEEGPNNATSSPRDNCHPSAKRPHPAVIGRSPAGRSTMITEHLGVSQLAPMGDGAGVAKACRPASQSSSTSPTLQNTQQYTQFPF
ncbi:hypothetical protein DAPPUDRAFT_251997 [Daphnia pulex]|uniref:Uncharacterized protein n=1 Tax=Daphnia pulex TaxID=6669 RepID=E9H1P7_DAPPU|nr:hypothetical protein DAPPUDRAFT_251997 [Daphnia pulex]|eukprot:EFX74335.1 hypothetical protein DAPPUDRAFT_251997 [Daphnia pulex]